MSDTGFYLGFDTATYPGDSAMGWMWGQGFRICGFYLNHRRGSEDPTWIPRRALLTGAGWGLAPIYLGWQMVDNGGSRLPPPTDPHATASTDATEAVGLMNKAGFAPGSAVFFDIEDGTPPSGPYHDYLIAWSSAVAAAGFLPAVYCSHLCNDWAAGQSLAHWCFHLASTDPGPYDPAHLPQPGIDTGSVGVQFLQNVHLSGLPLKVDLNWFAVPDPSSGHATAQLVM